MRSALPSLLTPLVLLGACGSPSSPAGSAQGDLPTCGAFPVVDACGSRSTDSPPPSSFDFSLDFDGPVADVGTGSAPVRPTFPPYAGCSGKEDGAMWFQVVDKGTTYTFEASGPGLTPPFAKGDSVSVHYSIGREVPAISPYEESLSVRTASGELLLALSPSPPAEVTVALGESVCQSVKSDLLSVWSNLDVTVSGQHATVPPGVGVVVGGLLVAQSDPSSQRWLQQVADGFLPRPRVLVAKQ